jgi:hypothetical protein
MECPTIDLLLCWKAIPNRIKLRPRVHLRTRARLLVIDLEICPVAQRGACIAHDQGIASRGLGVVIDLLDVHALGQVVPAGLGNLAGVVAVAEDALALDGAVGEVGWDDLGADLLGAGTFCVYRRKKVSD